ncbi:MAG: hydroxyacid dehydrogenase [Lentisphaeria bacterium]|nr:hydroxyacid dehydrogenase [Lentisphaeria bacterium]NQZ69666.1 hydroxyacid dehydrogenase [Lentisphaeria bacterium]
MKPRVFIPEPIAECGMKLLQESCDCIAPWVDGQELSDAEQKEILYGSNAVIVRLFKISAEDLEKCPDLKVIGKHGVGVDNIDCQAATARGIPVVFTPTANSNAVAEHAIGLMMALARNIVPSSVALRDGRFADRNQFTGVELSEKTLGVVGLGRIGSRVAEIASAGLNMKVCGYDPYLNTESYEGPAEIVSTLNDLFGRVDFLTLHVALSPETEHLIDDERIAMLKPGCRIINTSRGAVVDESALIRALEEERIAGAAIDVFEEEPVPADHPLCAAPNLLLTPHISSSSHESMDRMANGSAQGVLDVLNGKTPEFVANPDVMK